jgi:hypothetical protein
MRCTQRIAHLCWGCLVTAFIGPAACAERLPAAVNAELNGYMQICRDAGGRPDVARAVTTVDFTGDGIVDFLLDVGSFDCQDAWSVFGDRQKPMSVFVGDGRDGAKQAFADTAYGVRIERQGAATRLWITVAGQDCGKPPARDFASETFCERSLVWKTALQRFELAPVVTARMIE